MTPTFQNLAAAIKHHLTIPGDNLLAEMKKLTPTDRDDLRRYFAAEGITIAS